MPRVESPAEPLFWAQDIKPSQVHGLARWPATHISCLRSYGERERLRYAAIVLRSTGRSRVEHLSLSGGQVEEYAGRADRRPIGIDADRSGGEWRYTLLTQAEPSAGHVIATGLNEEAVHDVMAAGNHVVDFADCTTPAGAAFAAIFAAGERRQVFLGDVSARELLNRMRAGKARPVRIRSHGDSGSRRFSAVLALDAPDRRHWACHLDLDGDTVGRRLHRSHAFVVDLDVYERGSSVRFNVVTYSARTGGLMGMVRRS